MIDEIQQVLVGRYKRGIKIQLYNDGKRIAQKTERNSRLFRNR